MSARSILTIAWHEYIINLLRPGFLFFTLLIPALGLIGVIVAGFFSGQALQFLENQFESANRPAGLVDETGLFTPVPFEFSGAYVSFGSEAEARQALLSEQINGYAVIPADYLETGTVTIYSIGSFFEAATSISGDELRPLLVRGLLEGQVDAALLERAADPANITPVTLNEEGQPTGGTDIGSAIAGFVIPYVLSIFLIISVFTASSYLLRSVSEEKETRVIEIVLSSVSAGELLTGKVLGLGALGLTQVLVWLGSAFLLTGGLGAVAAGVAVVLSPRVFALSVVYFVLGYLLYGTLMAAAGALGTNMRESQQMAGLFSFASAVPMMFNSVIFTSPNGTFSRVMSFFPLTAPTTMMLRLPLTNVPALDLAISIGVLALSIPVVIWAGAKVFRMGLLLYGKRPGVRQIWRAMREA
jgi:ABC-2 type transport system permease protein